MAPSATSASSLKNTRAIVYGLGRSGIASVRLLLREGASVRVIDQRSASELKNVLNAFPQTIALVSEAEASETVMDADLVVVSPGVPLSNPALQQARAAQVPVWGEVELAYRFLPAASQRILIGITGTNGKSTTTALTGELFRQAGKKTFVGGNLGPPLSEALEPQAVKDDPYEVYVLELSSYQLEGMSSVRLNGAALLNLTPDHLDRYASIEAYGAAKKRIFLNQQKTDFAVVNADDAQVMSLASGISATVHTFSKSIQPHGYTLTNPALRGQHNLENALAASMLARLSGVDASTVQRGLDAYTGLSHRLESIGVIRDVEWINDSKATNVDSALVALKAFPGNVWWVAGGKGKGASYAPLVSAAEGRVKGVLTVGQDAPAIEAAFRGKLPVYPCSTIKGAVDKASTLAEAGDVVLLSPACASFDQFKNFEARGDHFKFLVKSLVKERP